MKDDSIIDFYFGDEGEQYILPFGDIRCRMQCFEWSDGRLPCFGHTASIVQESRRTGKFIWYTDYVTEGMEMGKSNKASHYGFHKLQEAYHQLKPIGGLDDKRCISLLLEIIRAYNDEFRRNGKKAKKATVCDLHFFTQCILEVENKGKNLLPASIRAELYREAGIFEKCFEFDAAASSSEDEREIITEIQFRAAHLDREPFIIEHCEFYRNNIRFAKRFPCPKFDN